MSTNTNIGSVRKTYCSSCQGDRNCEVKGHYGKLEEHDDAPISWRTDWYVLECRGCEYVFVQTVATNSEDYVYDVLPSGEEVREHIETVETWPSRSKRPIPDWFNHFYIETDIKNTGSLAAALKELYGALDADLFVLASIGIRTSFDIASEILGVAKNLPFTKKLEALAADGKIQETDRVSLDVLINAGSASAHRGWKPDEHELKTLMDILEDFVLNTMVLPSQKRAQAEAIQNLKNIIPSKSKKVTVAGPRPK